MLSVGAVAPDFDLPGVHGLTGERGRWKLSELLGQPVVLAFYPADSSPVCRRQLTSYTAGIRDFERLDAQVLAISHQSPESHLDFARDAGGFAFPMLADEDRAVARAYGVLGLMDLYRRCTFVVGPDGRIAYVHRAIGPGLSYRSVDDLTAAITTALRSPGT